MAGKFLLLIIRLNPGPPSISDAIKTLTSIGAWGGSGNTFQVVPGLLPGGNEYLYHLTFCNENDIDDDDDSDSDSADDDTTDDSQSTCCVPSPVVSTIHVSSFSFSHNPLERHIIIAILQMGNQGKQRLSNLNKISKS